jgi:hypothetical protein
MMLLTVVSLIDNARVVIYDHNMLIIQVTGSLGRGWTQTLALRIKILAFCHCAKSKYILFFTKNTNLGKNTLSNTVRKYKLKQSKQVYY